MKKFRPFAEAISKLLAPFAEVVIHDLEKNQIEAIYNPLSHREVGDNSYLEKMSFNDSENVIGPYHKTNWDGRPMKSISVVIRNLKGVTEGFLCINIDTSTFVNANQMLQTFLKNNVNTSEVSQELFTNDLYEKINLYIQSYCQRFHISIDTLSRKNKRDLIRSLVNEGAFQGKNAANYVARILRISRATVYNYLKEEGEDK